MLRSVVIAHRTSLGAASPAGCIDGGEVVGGFDQCGEAVELGNRGFVGPHLDRRGHVGVALGLPGAHDRSDRDVGTQRSIAGDDLAVLRVVQVELEHDPVGGVVLGARALGQQRARGVLRAV